MAAFYLIATLMVLQGLLVSYCETSVTSTSTVTGSNTPPTTVQATPSLGGNETTAMAGGTVTTAAGGNTVTSAVGGGSVTTAAGGNTVTLAVGGGTVTTAAGGNTVTSAVGGGAVTTAMSGGGGEGSATTVAGSGGISSSKITTTITSSVVCDKEQGETTAMGTANVTMSTAIVATSTTNVPMSSANVPMCGVNETGKNTLPEKKPGPTVILGLIRKIICSCVRRLLEDIKTAFIRAGLCIKELITKSISRNSPLNITLKISFYSGFPSGKTIKGVFQAALKGGNITNLTESNTIFTVTFIGVTLKYKPDAKRCQEICCDGPGGKLTVERECTPKDKCEGIEPDEKQEEGHCPGEEKGTCTCGVDGINDSSSFALVTLLAIVTFIKTMFF